VSKKQLPHDLDAEIAVVGAVAINPDVTATIFAMLAPEDFYDPRCRKIFAVQRDLGEGIDFVTIQAGLEARGWLDQVGIGFLTGTLAVTPSSLNGPHYAGVVRERSLQRQLMFLAARLTRQAFEPGADTSVEEIIESFQHELLALTATGQAAAISAPEAAQTLRQQIAAWAADPTSPAGVRGLRSGLGQVDSVLHGMQAGDLILLAARPSMGKSALGFEMARKVAEQGHQVLIFSLEMGYQQVLSRWVSNLSGVPGERMERGLCPPEHAGTAMQARYLSEPELKACFRAIDEIAKLESLTIVDQASLTAEQIRAQALSQAAKTGGLDLVVVDHTGLIDPSPARRHELSAKREGAKSRAMKALAKELGVPVLLIQQLNRAVEARSDKVPTLADLRDSGEHEENADVVLALYSKEYYKTDQSSKPDKLRVLCLKHRRGKRQKRAVLWYERSLSRFSSSTAAPPRA
jgi:replicative DNA helicase